MTGLLPHEEAAFRTALKKLHARLKDEHGIVPIPAICTGPEPHEWIDGNGNGAIRAPSLQNCRCFWCGRPLVPHPRFITAPGAEEPTTARQASLLEGRS